MINPAHVALHRGSHGVYTDAAEASAAIRSLAKSLEWLDTSGAPFGRIVSAGAKVVVKPNWVLHENQGPWGLEPLVTHSLLIRTVVEALLESAAARVTVGDAPLQECSFERLINADGLGSWAAALSEREPRFRGPRDYRRTKATKVDGVRVEREELVPLDQFVLFDLAEDSLLEPITEDGRFRVTVYPPAELAKTHARGRHQYLVARDIIEADVVVNMPKLKTHKKAGVTCALKNLIGINGNKEFLPHHRLGGSTRGGDCYPGADPVKRALEFVLDQENATHSHGTRRAWSLGKRALSRILHERSDQLGVEGAWSGNDTIWRTCLDLNRILRYGRPDGTLSSAPQRRVIHVVDAIVAGHGDGPLRPEPLELGLLIGGNNAAAVDYVGARLLGYDPSRIPIVAHAFDEFRWPLREFSTGDVVVTGALGNGRADDLVYGPGADVHYPHGWLDAVGLQHAAD